MPISQKSTTLNFCERKILQLIEQKTHELNQEKQNLAQLLYNIGQQKKALEDREKKLIQVEDLIPSAKQLKEMGVGFTEAIVWIDCIKEVSENEGVDERTAAWKLSDMLKNSRLLVV
jgi:hypothetical protein